MSEDGSAPQAQLMDEESATLIAQHALELSESFVGLSDSLKQAVGDSMENTLEHLLVQETAAEHLQESTRASVDVAYRLMQSALKLNRSLRGLDLLAEQVRTVRKAVDELDGQVNMLVAKPR